MVRPGGRVQKGERLREVVHRISDAELGVDVTIEHSLDEYVHLYDTSGVGDTDGKHCIPHGFVVRTQGESFTLGSQHDVIEVFAVLPEDLHEYIVAYLRDAGVY